MKLPSKFTPPPHKLTALLAAALLALAVPAQAQWPAANLERPAACTFNNPTYELTELYRTGYGDGIGEPSDGFGITPKGSGHVVREGANFAILYRMKACVNANDSIFWPTARVTLDPDGNAKGWNLGATFTGDRGSGAATDETVSRGGRWIKKDHYSYTGEYDFDTGVSAMVLDIWVHGTTTDDNCTGIPTGSSATASVSIYLLDGSSNSQRALEITLRKQEDNDALRGARYGVFPCT